MFGLGKRRRTAEDIARGYTGDEFMAALKEMTQDLTDKIPKQEITVKGVGSCRVNKADMLPKQFMCAIGAAMI